MATFPTGITDLDTRLADGLPTGSLILLAGPTGAGHREFTYTTTAANTLLTADPDTYIAHYGEPPSTATPPDSIHYLSLAGHPDGFKRALTTTLPDDLAATVHAADPLHFQTFATDYYQLSTAPPTWALDHFPSETAPDLDTQSNATDATAETADATIVNAIGDYLTAHAADSLVIIDSITDLTTTLTDSGDWASITLLLKALKECALVWDCVIYVLANSETLTDQEFGHLAAAADGTFRFAWDTSGSTRNRTLTIDAVPGATAAETPTDTLAQFETTLRPHGFAISEVRKIR